MIIKINKKKYTSKLSENWSSYTHIYIHDYLKKIIDKVLREKNTKTVYIRLNKTQLLYFSWK